MEREACVCGRGEGVKVRENQAAGNLKDAGTKKVLPKSLRLRQNVL
jgi:hypothetical protein